MLFWVITHIITGALVGTGASIDVYNTGASIDVYRCLWC